MPNRLALIYPSMHNDLYASELLYSPLALAYVAAYTPGDWTVTMYDEYVDAFVDPAEIQADLVAMSALTPNILRAYYLADKLRERGIRTVCGGAHVSALPREALQHFDSVVLGEAEGAWPQLIRDFEAGRLQPVYMGGMANSVEKIRLPRRDLISPRYTYPSVITSKGCPYRCDYCYLSVYRDKTYRVLPVDAILEDLDRAAARADFAVIIVDENISGYSKKDEANRMELFERMARRRYRFRWGAQSTIDVYKKPEMLKAMRAAGCRALFIGLEAVETNLRREVNKGFADKIDYKHAVKVIHRHGIGVIGSFILGLDNQDMAYARRLPKAMRELNIEYPRLFFLTAWPGTPLWHRLRREGRLQQGYCHVRKDIPNIEYLNFTEEEIREAERTIYENMFTLPYLVKTALRWVFRDPRTLWWYLKLVRSNTGVERHRRKKEQEQKEAYIREQILEHFRGTEMDPSATIHKEIGGDYRRVDSSSGAAGLPGKSGRP